MMLLMYSCSHSGIPLVSRGACSCSILYEPREYSRSVLDERREASMHQPFSLPAGNRVNNRRQAYALLLLGVVFLFIAWLGILNPYALGVLLFGLGMLAVAPLNPRRYLSAGWLTTSLGVATFLMFRNYIPASQILTAHLLAIGLGLLGIAWMAQRGYTSRGELTPGEEASCAQHWCITGLKIACLPHFGILSFKLTLQKRKDRAGEGDAWCAVGVGMRPACRAGLQFPGRRVRRADGHRAGRSRVTS